MTMIIFKYFSLLKSYIPIIENWRNIKSRIWSYWCIKILVLFCSLFFFSLSHRKLLLLLSHFSRVWLCATPKTAAHQAPPPLGFSRQEHWSGLPFPSPMHESEKWKWSRSVMSDSLQPHGLQPTRDFPGKSTGVGCHCLLQQKATHVILEDLEKTVLYI